MCERSSRCKSPFHAAAPRHLPTFEPHFTYPPLTRLPSACEPPAAALTRRRAGWVQTDMGGAQAHLTVQQACDALTELFLGLGKEKNGCFLNYDGTELPW